MSNIPMSRMLLFSSVVVKTEGGYGGGDVIT